MPPRQPLSDLLRDLFDEHELRRLASGLSGAEDLTASLPGSKTSRAELAGELAASLERRNLIDARLFALLLQQRPRQDRAIVRVADAWGVAPAAIHACATSAAGTSQMPGRRGRMLFAGVGVAALLAAGLALVYSLSGAEKPCFPGQDDVVGIGQARQACAAYLDTVRAFNARDRRGYEAGFAEPMECFYDDAISGVRMRHTGMRGSLDVDADSVSFLRLESDSRVVLCDLGIYDNGDGKGRRPHNKVIVMVKQDDRWKVTVETTRGATGCYRSPC